MKTVLLFVIIFLCIVSCQDTNNNLLVGGNGKAALIVKTDTIYYAIYKRVENNYGHTLVNHKDVIRLLSSYTVLLVDENRDTIKNNYGAAMKKMQQINYDWKDSVMMHYTNQLKTDYCYYKSSCYGFYDSMYCKFIYDTMYVYEGPTDCSIIQYYFQRYDSTFEHHQCGKSDTSYIYNLQDIYPKWSCWGLSRDSAEFIFSMINGSYSYEIIGIVECPPDCYRERYHYFQGVKGATLFEKKTQCVCDSAVIAWHYRKRDTAWLNEFYEIHGKK